MGYGTLGSPPRSLGPLLLPLAWAPLLCACATSSVSAVTAASPPVAAADDVASITRIEYELGRCQIRRDPKTLGGILASDFLAYTQAGEPITRAEWMTWAADPEQVIEELRYSPFDVRVMGDVAVVWGSNEDKSSLKGVDSSGAYNWMDVFARRDGRWKLFANETKKLAPGTKRRPGVWVTVTREEGVKRDAP